MRIMGLLPSDAATEAGVMPPAELFVKMGAFMEEVAKAGILVGTDGLQPTSKGKRVKLEDGQTTVIDGPFTESKELIASYALFEVKSMEEAVYWTTRFLEVLGSGECELRPIFEATDFPPELFSPDQAAQEDKWRQEMQERAAQ